MAELICGGVPELLDSALVSSQILSPHHHEAIPVRDGSASPHQLAQHIVVVDTVLLSSWRGTFSSPTLTFDIAGANTSQDYPDKYAGVAIRLAAWSAAPYSDPFVRCKALTPSSFLPPCHSDTCTIARSTTMATQAGGDHLCLFSQHFIRVELKAFVTVMQGSPSVKLRIHPIVPLRPTSYQPTRCYSTPEPAPDAKPFPLGVSRATFATTFSNILPLHILWPSLPLPGRLPPSMHLRRRSDRQEEGARGHLSIVLLIGAAWPGMSSTAYQVFIYGALPGYVLQQSSLHITHSRHRW